ncbi:MAG: hypothetical protein ACKOJF_16725, partial [Planctomycetaceae bacterium]
MSTHEDHLRGLIAKQQIVVVVGAGVSMSTTTKALNWRDLLLTALDDCRKVGMEEADCDIVRQMLGRKTNLNMLLSAAEQIHSQLGGREGGDFQRWLRSQFGGLTPEKPELIRSIHALNAPLLTTNYDGLIEAVTQFEPVIWT